MKWRLELWVGEHCLFSGVVEAGDAVDALRHLRSVGCLGGSVGIELSAIDRIKVERIPEVGR